MYQPNEAMTKRIGEMFRIWVSRNPRFTSCPVVLLASSGSVSAAGVIVLRQPDIDPVTRERSYYFRAQAKNFKSMDFDEEESNSPIVCGVTCAPIDAGKVFLSVMRPAKEDDIDSVVWAMLGRWVANINEFKNLSVS